MTVDPGRRRLLLLCATWIAGCGETPNGSETADGGQASVKCAPSNAGPGLSYCQLEGRSLRVPGGASLAVGQAVLVTAHDVNGAVLVRDAAGFYALSAICTHRCCLVSICTDAACASRVINPGDCTANDVPATVPAGERLLFCFCHGSEYRADGTVLKGPAKDPLPALLVTVDGTDVVIDTSQPVDRVQRAT